MNLRYTFFLSLCYSFIFIGCQALPKGGFSSAEIPAAPDYSQDRFWAALPWQDDAADLCPDGLTDGQDDAKADVFFLHPTTYTGKSGDRNWNGPVRDADVNERTQEGPIQFQATIFNDVGRVFAPYYRQAHLHAYHAKDTASAERAFELAYSDVRKAFRYYLAHYNQGRPIIIATHSQGTTHGIRLVQEFFDGQELQEQLVAAYLIGIPVLNSYFEELTPCETEEETGCYCAWRTFRRGVEPKESHPEMVVTNPLSWSLDEQYVAEEENSGAVLRPFEQIRPAACDAQVYGPILWASKPKFPGSIFFTRKNYHIGDYNLFYSNIRENAGLRLAAFLEE